MKQLSDDNAFFYPPRKRRSWQAYKQLNIDLQIAGNPARALAEGTKQQKERAVRTYANTGRYLALAGKDLSTLDLAHVNLDNFNLRKTNLRGTTITQANNADMSGANLTNTNMGGANLTGTNFSNAWMIGTNAQNAALQGAQLRGTIQAFCNFTFARAAHSNWDNTIGIANQMGNSDLQQATYRGGAQLASSLFNANARGMVLDGTQVNHTDMSYMDISRGVLATRGDEGVDMGAVKMEGTKIGFLAEQIAHRTSADMAGAVRIAPEIQPKMSIGAIRHRYPQTGLRL